MSATKYFTGIAGCLLGLGLCPLVGCSNEGGPPGSNDPVFGKREECPGAFTPDSDECWDRSQPTTQEIMANRVVSEENNVFGDRCARPQPLPGPATEGTLTVSFTTTRLGNTQYGPRNCGAAWIEDEGENYVRTIEAWFAERRTSVTMWDLRNCDTDAKVVDVLSSATLPDHVEHKNKIWDSRDFKGNVVPDGKYTLWMQVTENEIVPEGPYITIPFVKGSTAFKEQPAPMDGFTAITLEYKPQPPPAPGAPAP